MPSAEAAPALPRELGLRDLTLFTTATIIGTRWIPAAARAGPGSVTLLILAALFLMIPLAIAVAVLGVKHKGSGGLYLWTRNDFGPWHGFFAFWVYWVGIAFWFPSAAMFYMSSGLHALGPAYAHLAGNRWVVVAVSLAAIWIALGSNLVGLRIGKWTQNIGGACGWVLCAALSAGAWMVWMKRGSATPLDIVPRWDWGTLSYWSAIAYALSGVEVAGMMTGEIRDPVRTLPRAAAIASVFVAGFYISSTVALLVLLRPENVSEIYGLAQGGAVLARELAASWIEPVIAILVLGSAVGQFGGIGTGVSRLPLAAGVDHLLPAAFGRIHPRWKTPHVAILSLGAVASAMLVAMQFGDTIRAAYQALVSLMLLGGFFPFLYIFASAWKARCRVSGGAGFAVTLLVLVCTVVPGDSVGSVWAFETKLVLGTAAVAGSAWLMYRRRA